MRLGLFLPPDSLEPFREAVRSAADEGFKAVWTPQIFGLDALTALAVVAQQVPGIELGTAVVPTYPRHPMMLAQQAITTQQACKGRFTLGIGLSHQIVIEGMYGMSFERPAVHMRDYLSILVPLLRDGSVSYEGKTLTGKGQLGISDRPPVPVLVAALATKMLELAGSLAEGTITWMTGPRTVEEHIIPVMSKAAQAAGRPQPRTIVGLPVCLTNDVDGARSRAAKELVMYGRLPSYRAVLDREGLDGPADLAVVGDAKAIESGLRRAVDAGADEIIVSPFGSADEQAATRALLTSL